MRDALYTDPKAGHPPAAVEHGRIQGEDGFRHLPDQPAAVVAGLNRQVNGGLGLQRNPTDAGMIASDQAAAIGAHSRVVSGRAPLPSALGCSATWSRPFRLAA